MNLKEFAGLLGLSQTTVSRALSGYPEVKAETRERIEEAALKHGYHPNRAASGLATGRAGAIGYVLRSATEFGPHTSEFMGGFSAVLEKEGIDILVSTVDSREAEISTYRRLAASKRVDAVILHSPDVKDARVPLLRQLGLPFVLHGRTQDDQPYHHMDIDNYGAIHMATSHLLDLGHQRIAFINGVKGRRFAGDRDAGFRDAHTARGIEYNTGLFASGQFTDEMGFRFTAGFLEHANRPTAIIAGSMMSALGAMRAIRLTGLVLGSDVSLIAHDDEFPYLSADNMVPTLSTTTSSIRKAGVRVGQMLLEIMSGKFEGTFEEVWPVELVQRQSTGPAPKSVTKKSASLKHLNTI